ncbi:MAG: DUF1365 domain-containing protein [Parvibaculum sp.]|nr:DUF1365 domain-containing protein [Parvibaculum sp.]
MKSCLYQGHVFHARHEPKRHAFRYSVFSLLLDLDELDFISARSRVFGVNKTALLSFRERDHGNGTTNGLKSWVISELHAAGIETSGVSIRVLCYPRILGYVFNPLTVYYCFAKTGELIATLHEVHNTFNEKHTYILPIENSAKQMATKVMHVSPFTEMTSRYQFEYGTPNEKVHLVIRLYTNDELILSTSFAGTRHEMSDRALLATFFRYPLMTLKIISAIHFEAFRLWHKGVPLVARVVMPEKITASYVTPQKKEGRP